MIRPIHRSKCTKLLKITYSHCTVFQLLRLRPLDVQKETGRNAVHNQKQCLRLRNDRKINKFKIWRQYTNICTEIVEQTERAANDNKETCVQRSPLSNAILLWLSTTRCGFCCVTRNVGRSLSHEIFHAFHWPCLWLCNQYSRTSLQKHR